MPSKPTWVIAQDLIRVIFKDMDLVWLRTMWEDGGIACVDMIEILISLVLLKLRSRLWSVDPFERQCLLLCCYGLYPYLMMVWWLVHFDDYLCYDDVIFPLVNVVWILNYWLLIPIVLVKSSTITFSLRQERLKSLSLVPWGIGLGGEPWDQLLVNWFAYRGRHSWYQNFMLWKDYKVKEKRT